MASNLQGGSDFNSAFNDLKTYLSNSKPNSVDDEVLASKLQNIYDRISVETSEMDTDLKSECCLLIADLARKHPNNSGIASDEAINKIASSILSKLSPRLPAEILRHGILPHLLESKDYKSFGRMGLTDKAQKTETIDLISHEGPDLQDLGLDTKEKALDYVIKNKLKAVNLKSYLDITCDDLERLAREHPQIENLTLKTYIPIDEEPKLLKSFPNLKSFENEARSFRSFEGAKKYIANFNTGDEASSLPYLKGISFMGELVDSELSELLKSLPKLETINMYLPNITSFSTNAKKVNCSQCIGLKSISANNAKQINCSGCINLNTLSANEALEVNCSSCKSLTSLSLNKAEKVDCYGCKSLTSLIAPEARFVDCYACESLTSLSANKAEKVDCYRCSSLTSLIAPEARFVDCYACESLTSLSANKAEKVYCNGCKSLTSLTTPKATMVDCRGCTQLKKENIEVTATCKLRTD